MKKLLVTSLLLLVLSAASIWSANLGQKVYATEPYVEWSRIYGEFNGVGRVVIQTVDGGYAVAGVNNGKFLLLKVEKNGEVQWNRTFDKEGSANTVLQTSDGGYLLAGNSTGADLIKADGNGNLEWTKTCLQTPGSFYASSLIKTQDGGYAMTGFLLNFTGVLLKLDAEGNLLWSKTYGDNGFPYPRTFRMLDSIVETSSGGYALAADGCFALTDSSGNLQWAKDTAGLPYFFAQALDGGYCMTGMENRSNGTERRMASIFVKTDALGNWEWSKTIAESGYSQLLTGALTSIGGFVVAGTFYAEQHVERVGNVTKVSPLTKLTVGAVKVDANGNVLGNVTYPPSESGNNFIASIIESSDGHYVIAGSFRTNEGKNSVWLTKTEIGLTPDILPPNITVLSPKNMTYNGSAFLTFRISEPTIWSGYSLDGERNVTVCSNVTLDGLTEGAHSLIVYANDISGNVGTSATVYFSSSTAKSPQLPSSEPSISRSSVPTDLTSEPPSASPVASSSPPLQPAASPPIQAASALPPTWMLLLVVVSVVAAIATIVNLKKRRSGEMIG